LALTQVWKLRGTSDTTIGATDLIQFSDGTFDNPITVSSFNGGTHVRSSGGSDSSAANTPNNVKYIASGTADWGDGTEACANMLATESTLLVTVGYDTNITVTGITFYAYDGTTPATAPTNLDVYAFEFGDSAWVNIDGSGSALALGDSTTPATSHPFSIALSASPSAVGTQSANKVKFSFTYQ
jgi:hypothetical protein